MNELFDQ